MKPKRKILFTMLGASLAFAGCLTAFGLSMNINTQEKNVLSDEHESTSSLEYANKDDYGFLANNDNSNVYNNSPDSNAFQFEQNIVSKLFNNKIVQVNTTNENTNNNADFANDSIVEASNNSQVNNSQENSNKDSRSQSDDDAVMYLGAQYVENTPYIDADGNEQICTCARVITNGDNVLYGNDENCHGWYVVHQSVQTSSVKCEGDVKVIIEKNCTYEVISCSEESACINVTGNNQFSLYSQVKEAKDSPENGILKLVSFHSGGIGGNAGEEGCNIGIFGCVVMDDWTARGTSAVIGGGENKDGYNILIKRAVIKDITIWSMYSEPPGAVIGGGSNGEGQEIVITDSIIKSDSVGGCGALIGGGSGGGGHNIKVGNTILGGDTEDKMKIAGAGAVIGGGADGNGYDMTFVDCSMDINHWGREIGSGAIIGGGDEAYGYRLYIEGGSYDLAERFDYYDEGYAYYAAAACIGGGENAEGHDITITGANIKAKSDKDSAAIGGGQGCKGYNITIENSNVDAQGGEDAAGIGGGSNSMGYGIKIFGGTVTAKGGENGAGIGCGNDAVYSCGQDELNNAIIIEGNGIVNAYGGDDAAGIGGGSNPDDVCVLGIHIKGGTVNAYGGSGSYGGGAGIGGGNDNHGKVTITGGVINAHGGGGYNGGGAGIGGGDEGFGTVDIYDGLINAYGGGCASGIGGGDDDDDDSDSRSAVYLHSPARVYAEKGPDGDDAMAIGCGDGGNAPAVWAFPDLDIYKCVGSNWSDVDYSAKQSSDKSKSDNLVNQISDAEKIKINIPVVAKAITPEMIESIPDQAVKSSVVEPYPVVKDGNVTLIYGTDYNLRWEHNQGVGIGKVYVEGMNNYYGTAEAEFKIVPTTEGKTSISYVENGHEKFVDALRYNSKQNSLSNGWYYVYGNVTSRHSITVNGDVHIVLVDGACLNFYSGRNYPFIYGDSNSKVTLHYQYLNRGMINTQKGRTQLNEVSFGSAHNIAYCNSHVGVNIDPSKVSGVTFITGREQFSVNDLHIASNHINYSIDIDKCKSAFKEGDNAYKIIIKCDGRQIQIDNDLNIVKSNTANDQATTADKNTSAKSPVSLDNANGQITSAETDTNIGTPASSDSVKSLNGYVIKKVGN